jgi:hypothetical protein
VVSFKPQPLYPGGKYPRYTLNRKSGEPHSQSGLFGENKSFLPPKIAPEGKFVKHSGSQKAVTGMFTRVMIAQMSCLTHSTTATKRHGSTSINTLLLQDKLDTYVYV